MSLFHYRRCPSQIRTSPCWKWQFRSPHQHSVLSQPLGNITSTTRLGRECPNNWLRLWLPSRSEYAKMACAWIITSGMSGKGSGTLGAEGWGGWPRDIPWFPPSLLSTGLTAGDRDLNKRQSPCSLIFSALQSNILCCSHEYCSEYVLEKDFGACLLNERAHPNIPKIIQCIFVLFWE